MFLGRCFLFNLLKVDRRGQVDAREDNHVLYNLHRSSTFPLIPIRFVLLVWCSLNEMQINIQPVWACCTQAQTTHTHTHTNVHRAHILLRLGPRRVAQRRSCDSLTFTEVNGSNSAGATWGNCKVLTSVVLELDPDWKMKYTAEWARLAVCWHRSRV